jgi:hypothetical protein
VLRSSRLIPLGALVAASLLIAIVAAGAAPAAPAKCPTFRVLHDDRIGSVSLPAGTYGVSPTKLSCATASDLFTEFLDDWDGKLPRPWKIKGNGVGKATFTGSGGQRFSVARGGGGGGGGGGGQHPASGLVCSTRLAITADERIGALKLAKGTYIIDRLSTTSPSCDQDIDLATSFLADFDGKLPDGWVVLPDDGTFVRGSVTYGFRLEPASGGGKHPHRFPASATRCGPTFHVLHADHVGRLRFPAGQYWLYVLKGSTVSCSQAPKFFALFLARPAGDLPKPWIIDTSTGTFLRGKGGSTGFRAKPAFRVR